MDSRLRGNDNTMGSELLIKNGWVIDPANGIDEKCDVLIVEEKIAEVGKIERSAQTVIDATGKLVVPGLIDIHVHFREPGDEEEETIASGSAAAVQQVLLRLSVCQIPTLLSKMRPTSNTFIERAGRQEKPTSM